CIAQIDTLVTIVDSATATGGSPMGAYGYNPTNNTMYAGSFGAAGTFQRIANVDSTPTAELAATQTELQLYLRDGNPDRGATSLMSGILLNPQPIVTDTGTIPAYSFAVVMDGN